MPCKQNREEVSPATVRALYVHVPFCHSKCRYCDFYSLPFDPPQAEACLTAMEAELAARQAHLSLPLTSIYVGGGTPTSLGPKLLRRLLSALARTAGDNTEFTVEANPSTADAAMADVLVETGVNRISLGVQSFRSAELTLLGRGHTPDQARKSVSRLREAGIGNLSLDLIYGIPNQTPASWRSSLAEAMALQPQHLSCYALSYEKHTPLGEDVLAGRIEPMDESLQRECYFAAISAASRAGLDLYELSNFARPGRQCVHNLTYWNNKPYLGIGPAAASYIAGERRKNRPDLAAYIAALDSGRLPPATSEQLTGRAAMAETLMLALRLTQGVPRKAFRERFGRYPVEAFPDSIDRYLRQGALIATPRHIRLSPDAYFVADTVLADILAEA